MNNSKSISLDSVVFMVDDQPYCLWSDKEIKEYTLEFINNIDPSYFDYQARTNLQKLNVKKHKQNAALAIRTAFSHGLETLFSLLCASIQAPYCVPGWLLLCKNFQLYNIVGNITSRKYVPSLLQTVRIDWQEVSSTIHHPLVLEDKDKEKSLKTHFGDLWERWASDFTSDIFRKEYNSIKHGFRVRSGGFSFAIGVEDVPGIRAPKEKMKVMGESDFGSSFFDYMPVGDLKNHIQLRRNSTNWSPEDMAWGLHLISASISNIMSFIKIVNGVDPTKVKFTWPNDVDVFQQPWQRSRTLGVTSLTGFTNIVPPELITKHSADKIKDLYNNREFLHRKIIDLKY